MMQSNSRTTALNLLLKFLKEHASFSTIFADFNDSQKPFIQALCYEVARWYFQLDFLVSLLVKKPIRKKDYDVHVLIVMGLCEILYLNTPDRVVVHEYVEVARTLNKSWTCPLVNACLRKFLRQKDEFLSESEKNPVAHYAHPSWFLNRLQVDWPDDWQTIASANNQHPPMSLRINRLKISRDEYLYKLKTEGIAARACEISEDGLVLNKPCDVLRLPGFNSGEIFVQDCGAQLAADLLDLKPDQRILDVCAAPGGKATHILERKPAIQELVAIDIDKMRLSKVADNLKRLNLKATLIAANALDIEHWWDGNGFDRILLDAPCSATGVIRRHPDIKYLRQSEDIANLAEIQQKLLNAIWPLLKTKGRLVYATCSVLSEENQKVVAEFLSSHADAVMVKDSDLWGVSCDIGRQLLPGQHGTDGFYFACLEKR